MMSLPTGLKGRLLAVGLTLIVLIASAAGVFLPVWVLHDRYDTARADAESRIDRYRKVASHRDESRRALEVLKARESSRFFLKNVSPSLAGPELTDLVRSLIETNGSRMTAVQPTTVKDDGGFRAYTVNLGFNATPANLQKTLYALETALPYLFLDNITLRATVPRGYKPPPNQEPEIAAQIEVQVYGRKDTAKSTRTAAVAASSQTDAPFPGAR